MFHSAAGFICCDVSWLSSNSEEKEILCRVGSSLMIYPTLVRNRDNTQWIACVEDELDSDKAWLIDQSTATEKTRIDKRHSDVLFKCCWLKVEMSVIFLCTISVALFRTFTRLLSHSYQHCKH